MQTTVSAQNAPAGSAPSITPITADSLASGNYKDVFASFFQLAFNDITGPQKQISFTSNPFAIMAKANPSLLVDTNYVKYTHLRNFNFNANIQIDSSYHISGFSVGFKYAIVNARDITVSKDFIVQALKANSSFTQLAKLAGKESSKKIYSEDFQDKVVSSLHAWETDSTVTFNSLDSSVQAFIDTVVAKNNLTYFKLLIKEHPDLNFQKESQKSFQELKSEWQSKPLWTIAANSIFQPNSVSNSNALALNTIAFSSEFLKGINPKNSIASELDILVTDNISADSTSIKQNLNRNVFTFQPGVNISVKSKKTDKSIFEFKISGSYHHIFSNPYPSEKADSSTINAEFRIRVINDLWVPVTIQYDPVNHNVFGLLNIKMNFTALTGLFKSSMGAK